MDIRTSLLLFAIPSMMPAQEDFRATDQDRPLRVEDAFPVSYLEWEVEFGVRAEFAEGADGGASVLELKSGLAFNLQAGIELHGEGVRSGGQTFTGVESLGAHIKYNFNREFGAAPAVSVRLDAATPGLGDLGAENWSARIKAIATRSFGRLRLHGNWAYSAQSASDGGDFWSGGLAFDYVPGFSSRSVMGDVYAEVPATGGDVRWWTEVGTRIQITNRSVLDVGLTTRMDELVNGVPNIGVVLGFSRVFGIPGLVGVPSYPDPSIR